MTATAAATVVVAVGDTAAEAVAMVGATAAAEEATVVVRLFGFRSCDHALTTLPGGDRMSGLGAGLGNIDWAKQQLTKFEKK